MQAYCVKCRAKKEMKNPKAITMKNGKPARQEGDEESQGDHHEEWQTRYSGRVSDVWHQDVQDRQSQVVRSVD